MIYLLWQTGGYNNDQIGRLFGVSYSAVSHAVRSLKSKLQDNHELLTTFNKINSQFNGLLPKPYSCASAEFLYRNRLDN